MMTAILTVKKLNVITYQGLEKKPYEIIKELDLTVFQGEILGIVGESGSGKSILMRCLKNILPRFFEYQYQEFIFESEMHRLDENLSIAMIFQDPKKAMNPVKTIGSQLAEVARRFQKVSKAAAIELSEKTLAKVAITNPKQRMKQYPHELSGGLQQRVMIAMALLTKSKVLIADEPTTALDAVTQKGILFLLKELQQTEGLTIILISHDLKVIKQVADRVAVMYFGEIVELGKLQTILKKPQHPYTKALLAASPSKSHELTSIPGNVPTMDEQIPGCFFASRCSVKLPECTKSHPLLKERKQHAVRCFYAERKSQNAERNPDFINESFNEDF